MRTLFSVLVFTLSVGFANPMPDGATGYDEAQKIISAVSGYQVGCVAGESSIFVELKSNDVLCAQIDISQTVARFAIDQTMSNYETRGAWKLLEGPNEPTRFVRLWTLGDGTLSVIIRPSGETEIVYSELSYLYR